MQFHDKDNIEQLRYFSNIENSSAIGVVCINKKFEILRVNRIIAERTKYDVSELIGRDVNILLPAPLRDIHETEHLPKWFEHPTSKPLNRENLVILTREGEEIPVFIMVFPYHKWKEDRMINFEEPVPPETFGIAKIIFKDDLR